MPKPKSKESLEEIYTLIVENLKTVMPNIEDELDYYQKLDCKSWSDNDFFEVLARTIFAGIRDETVEERWPEIAKAFSNFNIHKIAKYKEKDVKRLMKNPKIIKNERKIRYVIADAGRMEEIIEEYGSFANYINSFSSMDGLIEKSQGFNGGFKGIGGVNVYEFVKELGFPFIKPDRQVRKVFLPLGLIDKKASPQEIVNIGKAMAKAVKEKPAVVDCAIWYFGKKVCKAKRDCEKCSLINLCEFQH